MENPLLEAGSFSIGSRVAFRTEGKALDPIDGQFIMDFEIRARWWKPRLASVRVSAPRISGRSVCPRRCAGRGPSYCGRGDFQLQAGSTSSIPITLPRTSISAPSTTTSPITIWRKSIIARPSNAIRDTRWPISILGNVLDETQRLEEAIAAYKAALQLAPTYADAHYNLALAYERSPPAAPCPASTGAPISSWMAVGRGPCMPARSTESCWNPSTLQVIYRVSRRSAISPVAPISETGTIAASVIFLKRGRKFP